jgi:TAG lipase / steryl ester hydrolase / phospholipase A2 / LPA acyltransferase
VPTIGTTTQIGRTLDGILHAFEIDEAHWLRTAPQTNTALDSEIRRSGIGRGPAKSKRSKRVSKIIQEKAQDRSAA